MSETARYLPGTRSIVTLTDSFASIKLIQDELLRSKLGYIELGKRAGVAHTTIGRIASGTTKWPRLETVVRILGALDWVISARRRT